MAGEYSFLPNFQMPGNSYSQGLPGLGGPQVQGYNWNTPSIFSTGTQSPMMGGPATMSPEQARLGALNQQFQPGSVLPYIGAGIQGVSTLGNLFLGWQSLKRANEDSKWQKDMAQKNYANSVLSYNTAAEDKVRGRYAPTSDPATQAAIDAEVKRRTIGGK